MVKRPVREGPQAGQGGGWEPAPHVKAAVAAVQPKAAGPGTVAQRQPAAHVQAVAKTAKMAVPAGASAGGRAPVPASRETGAPASPRPAVAPPPLPAAAALRTGTALQPAAVRRPAKKAAKKAPKLTKLQQSYRKAHELIASYCPDLYRQYGTLLNDGERASYPPPAVTGHASGRSGSGGERDRQAHNTAAFKSWIVDKFRTTYYLDERGKIKRH